MSILSHQIRKFTYEEKLTALHKHALQLNSAYSLVEITKCTLDAMEFSLGFDFADVTLAEHGWLKMVGHRGAQKPIGDLHLDGRGVTVKAANSKTTVRIDDTAKEPAYVDGRISKGPPSMLSELAVPVLVDGETAAVLNVESERLAYFKDEDQQLLETLASHVAMAFSRLRRDDALQKSGESLQALFNATTDSAMLWDVNGTVLAANEVFARTIHKKPEEIIGAYAWNLIPPDSAKKRKVILEDIIRSRKPARFADERNGVWFDNSIYPILDAQGKATRLAIFAKDITEHKHLEDTLRRRAEELAALHETVLGITGAGNWSELLEGVVARATKLLNARGGGLYLCDPAKKEATCVVSYNTAPLDFRGNVLKYGKGVAGRVAENGTPIVIDDYQKWEGRAEVYEKNGLFGAVLAVPLIWQGQVTGVIDVMDEVALRHFTQADLELLSLFANHAAIAVETQRYSKSLESLVEERGKQLLEAKQRLEDVIASNPAVIYRGKPLPDLSDWYQTYVSERVRNILGFEPEEFVGHPEFWSTRVHPDDLPGTQAAAPRIFHEGHVSIDYRFLHKDGVYRWIREQATLTRDSEGRPIEVNGYWTDITELKELEQRLQQTEHMAGIGEAAAMVGHDLRNPLQGIAGAIYLLRDESLTADTRNGILQLIENCVEYSDGIVKDLLDYARPFDLVRADTTPKEIAAEAVEAVQIPSRIKVQNVTQDQPKISVDPDRMKRVFVNLIENAVDAMPDGGTLTIDSRESKSFVQLTISDTGIGMSKKALENL